MGSQHICLLPNREHPFERKKGGEKGICHFNNEVEISILVTQQKEMRNEVKIKQQRSSSST